MNVRGVLFLNLLSFVSQTVAQIHSNMIRVMEASKATGARTLLMLSNSDIERLYPRVNKLPTAVKFVLVTDRAIECEFYAYSEKQNCGIFSKHDYDFITLPRIAYVPFISSITQSPERWIMKLSRFRRIQFIISSEVHNHTLRRIYPDGLCDVVSVSSRDINAPADRYRRCGQRVNVTASSLFASDAASPNKFPKHQKYKAAMQLLGSSKGDINTNSEVLALMDAYKVLNNTVNVTKFGGTIALFEKSIDMVLRPVSTASLAGKELLADVYYSPIRCCFFTRRRIDIRMAFVTSPKSFLEFLMAIALVGALVALCVHTRSRVLFRGRALLTLPGFLLFMVGTFFGRCHTIPEAQASSYRSLAVASWILGMMFLGNFVQTSITAIRVLPSVSASVRTLEELQPYIDTCAMAPCLNDDWEDIFFSMSIPGLAPSFRLLRQSLRECRDTYYSRGDISQCYAKAHAGSHVMLSTCSDQELSAASQRGLAPSNDLFTFPQLFAIYWLNPASLVTGLGNEVVQNSSKEKEMAAKKKIEIRYQHRRILFAIAEHGLAVPHQRRVQPQMIGEDLGAEPFQLYFGVYLAGCVVSCAFLAAELLCMLKHRPRVGDIPQPLVLAAVSG